MGLWRILSSAIQSFIGSNTKDRAMVIPENVSHEAALFEAPGHPATALGSRRGSIVGGVNDRRKPKPHLGVLVQLRLAEGQCKQAPRGIPVRAAQLRRSHSPPPPPRFLHKQSVAVCRRAACDDLHFASMHVHEPFPISTS